MAGAMEADARKFLEDAANREQSNLVRLSIRDLLRHWGHKRRGYWVINRIQDALEEVGLVTEPPFTQGWIDAQVTLVPKRFATPGTVSSEDDNVTATPKDEAEVEPGEVTILVGSLRTAGQGVTSVALDSSLVQAVRKKSRGDGK